jgi:2-polyprenyl-3-methyl-5-hydroxy-6-metoxy-1,4-benzoquinol methylase
MKRTLEPELMDLPEEAAAYAEADFAEGTSDYIDRILQRAGDRESLAVVDLGTGPGTIPIPLAEARPTWHVLAVDASQAMLDIALHELQSARVEERVALRLADVKSTGLPAQQFDIVLCNSVLHHMPEPLLLWREIKRLAKHGGLVFVRDLARPADEAGARRLVQLHASAESQLLQEEFYRSLLAAFTLEEVRDQLAQAGLPSLQVAPLFDRYLEVIGAL